MRSSGVRYLRRPCAVWSDIPKSAGERSAGHRDEPAGAGLRVMAARPRTRRSRCLCVSELPIVFGAALGGAWCALWRDAKAALVPQPDRSAQAKKALRIRLIQNLQFCSASLCLRIAGKRLRKDQCVPSHAIRYFQQLPLIAGPAALAEPLAISNAGLSLWLTFPFFAVKRYPTHLPVQSPLMRSSFPALDITAIRMVMSDAGHRHRRARSWDGAPGPQLRSETTNLSWCRRRRDEARADPGRLRRLRRPRPGHLPVHPDGRWLARLIPVVPLQTADPSPCPRAAAHLRTLAGPGSGCVALPTCSCRVSAYRISLSGPC